jgi:outer membrane biosynthesis protein TonB
MRAGLTASIVGHAVILGLGLVAFEARPLPAEDIEALPVELISVADVTDLMAGIESSEVLPEEAPQPKPVIESVTPQPEPTETPAEEPVEAVAPPPAPEPVAIPEPTPEPEPAPPPEPEVAEPLTIPEPVPETAPEPEPEPRVVTDPNVPRSRPEPPQEVATMDPPRPLVAQEEPEKEFSTDDIAALLDKQEPQGGGDPEPATEPQTIGSIDGHAGAAMTQSEIAALKARLYQCWNPPVAVREAGSLVVEVQIHLLPDGSLAGPPLVTRVEQASDPVAQVAVEAATRAVMQCAPFGDILQPEKYAIWKQIDFVFDPREMLGG